MLLSKEFEAFDRETLDLKNNEKLYVEIVKLKKELDQTRTKMGELIKINYDLEIRIRNASLNREAICLNEENRALSKELKELKTNVARLEGLLRNQTSPSVPEIKLVAGKENQKW